MGAPRHLTMVYSCRAPTWLPVYCFLSELSVLSLMSLLSLLAAVESDAAVLLVGLSADLSGELGDGTGEWELGLTGELSLLPGVTWSNRFLAAIFLASFYFNQYYMNTTTSPQY